MSCAACISGTTTVANCGMVDSASRAITYDVHPLMQATSAHEWQADHALAIDCAQHAQLFFGNADLGLDTAIPGTFTLTPGAEERFEQVVNDATTAASLAHKERRE